MAVPTKTSQTYGVSTIREDIDDAVTRISPEETPILSALGTGKAESTYHEWTIVELDDPSDANAVVEGDDATNDDPNNGVKLANYTQISDKTVQVSSTNEAVRGVGDLQTMAKQIVMKGLALRRDVEKQMLSNKAASAGSASTARVAASIASFLQTNVSRGSGGANPALSGTTTGAPTTAATDGTQRALTEAMLKDVMQGIWTQGGMPKIVVCGAYNKRVISGFAGNATRFKEAEDKKLVAAIDIYVGDFGEVQIVPSRHIRPRDVLVLDPSKAAHVKLQGFKQEPLAKTGHSNRRMVSVEYTTKVHNEKAHGGIFDLTTSA